MVNFYESVLTHPNYYRQFDCNNSLITLFTCPLEARLLQTKFAPMWTEHNYLLYVVEGRKIWHTAEGTYDIRAGSCLFFRKGGFVLEQIFEAGFCVVLFFIPDHFICNTLANRIKPVSKPTSGHRQLISLQCNETLAAFFLSMSAYFQTAREPGEALLELKFKELILTIADNPANLELLSYFCALVHEPRPIALEQVMLENFRYNLKLEQLARLSNRSLSAFKRDFKTAFDTTPAKWLMEKRLLHAKNLLEHAGKTVSEASFESGFETPSHFSRSFSERFGVPPSSLLQHRVKKLIKTA